MRRRMPSAARMVRAGLLGLCLAATGSVAFGQSEAERARLQELDRQCEAARQAKLAPMRRDLIERCVREDKRPRADCEAEFGPWGETRGRAGGGAVGGLFYDLPECVAATQARARYRQ